MLNLDAFVHSSATGVPRFFKNLLNRKYDFYSLSHFGFHCLTIFITNDEGLIPSSCPRESNQIPFNSTGDISHERHWGNKVCWFPLLPAPSSWGFFCSHGVTGSSSKANFRTSGSVGRTTASSPIFTGLLSIKEVLFYD